MKRFKIGFAAIIAVLAFALTAATKADSFKGSFDKGLAAGCYTSVSPTPTIPPAPGGNTTKCLALDAKDQICVDPSNPINPDTDCLPPYNNVCCFDVIDDESCESKHRVVGVCYKQ